MAGVAFKELTEEWFLSHQEEGACKVVMGECALFELEQEAYKAVTVEWLKFRRVAEECKVQMAEWLQFALDIELYKAQMVVLLRLLLANVPYPTRMAECEINNISAHDYH